MRNALALLAVAALLLLATAAHADPGVLESGFTVRKFATIPQPTGISVAPDGTVWVGNDPPGGPANEPARIRRISPDGSTITEVGPLITDPDSVIVDVNGTVGNAGDVIVGAGSSLVALDPSTGTATTLFAGYPLANVGHMGFDASGRLFASGAAPRLAVVVNGGVFVYTTFPALVPTSVASDGGNTLYTAMNSGELYDVPLDGSPPNYLTNFGLPIDAVAYGRGAFGARLFAGDRVGNILVYDPTTGQIDTFAQGFARANSIDFGPDGSLFIADFAGNAIWVIEAEASLEVAPEAVDFGEVTAVWTTATTEVTISNAGSGDVTLTGVSLDSLSDASFSIVSAPANGTVLAGGETATVEILFAPDETGEFAGTLLVTSDASNASTLEIPLSGEGVEGDLTVSEMLELILELYGDYVEAGLIEGTGRGRSAAGRLNALHWMLSNAGRLEDKGAHDCAHAQLATALERADGNPRPCDFVAGDGTPRLAFLIQVAMDHLDPGTARHCRKVAHRPAKWWHRHHGNRHSRHHRHGCK